MNVSFMLGLADLTLVLATPKFKRAAYDLPDNAGLIVGDIRTTFICNNDGYYADQTSFCKVFHICHADVHSNDITEMKQWSLLCGNKTIFNQFSLTCSYPEDSVLCESASDFWYLNANLGAGPNVPVHNDQDVNRESAVLPKQPLKPKHIETSTISLSRLYPPSQPTPRPYTPPTPRHYASPPAVEAPVRPPPPKSLAMLRREPYRASTPMTSLLVLPPSSNKL